jgi:hypothetical protein
VTGHIAVQANEFVRNHIAQTLDIELVVHAVDIMPRHPLAIEFRSKTLKKATAARSLEFENCIEHCLVLLSLLPMLRRHFERGTFQQ